MSRADDLLRLAEHLVTVNAPAQEQAYLSRAVSTAYYALFHLLIEDATSNWREKSLRPALGRIFEHGKMKTACEVKINDLIDYFEGSPAKGRERDASIHLHVVASTFVQTQHHRTEADYNTVKEWTGTEVASLVSAVAVAFRSWKIVREEPAAQALLLAMLGRREPREVQSRTRKGKKGIPPIPSEDSLPLE